MINICYSICLKYVLKVHKWFMKKYFFGGEYYNMYKKKYLDFSVRLLKFCSNFKV